MAPRIFIKENSRFDVGICLIKLDKSEFFHEK
jgi:hypothetical protein